MYTIRVWAVVRILPLVLLAVVFSEDCVANGTGEIGSDTIGTVKAAMRQFRTGKFQEARAVLEKLPSALVVPELASFLASDSGTVNAPAARQVALMLMESHHATAFAQGYDILVRCLQLPHDRPWALTALSHTVPERAQQAAVDIMHFIMNNVSDTTIYTDAFLALIALRRGAEAQWPQLNSLYNNEALTIRGRLYAAGGMISCGGVERFLSAINRTDTISFAAGLYALRRYNREAAETGRSADSTGIRMCDIVMEALSHPAMSVRQAAVFSGPYLVVEFWSIRSTSDIAKTREAAFLQRLREVAQSDPDSVVRAEADDAINMINQVKHAPEK